MWEQKHWNLPQTDFTNYVEVHEIKSFLSAVDLIQDISDWKHRDS